MSDSKSNAMAEGDEPRAEPPKEVVTSKMLKMLGMTRAQYEASKLRESQGMLQDDLKKQHAEAAAKICSLCSTKLYSSRHRCWECGIDLCEACAASNDIHKDHMVSADQVEPVGPGRGRTIPRALRNAFHKFGPRPLFLVHESAEMDFSSLTPTHLHYSWISYSATYRRAMSSYRGLCASPGYNPERFVGICASNRLEWVLADLACLLNGIVSVPITTTTTAKEIEAIVRDCSLGAVVCSREMAPLFLFPGSSVTLVVLMQGAGTVASQEGVTIMTFEEVEALGAAQGEESLQSLSLEGDLEEVPDPSAQNLISLMYTSGSTGIPKGVMMGDYSWNSRLAVAGLSPVVGLEIVFLPLGHGTGRSQFLARLIDGGAVVLFDKERHDQAPGGGYAVLFEHIRLLRPTHHVGVPRFWNVVYSEFMRSVGQTLKDNPSLSRFRATEDMFAAYRAMFGDRLIAVGTGSASTSPEVFAWMRKCFKGVDCGDGYGTTETGGISGTGRPQRNVEMKLRDRPDLGFLSTDLPFPRGEILARTSGRALGYYNRPELSKEVFLEDGWYATGDIGQLEIRNGEQYFIIIDRGGDVFKLAQGEFVVPSKIEGALLASKYVSQLVVYGASVHSSVVAVVVPQMLPNPEANHPDNVALVLADLLAVGRAARLFGYEIPSNVWFETDPWTPENKLLTAAHKPNRPALLARYRPVFDRLYEEHATRMKQRLLEGNLEQLLGEAQLDSFSAVALSERMLRDFNVRVSAVSLLRAEGKLELETLVKNAPIAASGRGQLNWEQEAALPALPQPVVATPVLFDGIVPVLLTGASGFLGAHMLEALLKSTRSRIYCLVRSEERLRKHLERQCIECDWSRIRVLVGDLALHNMGLDKDAYAVLEEEVGCVFHSAAQVNHALPYNELKANNVDGARECLKLCISGRPKIMVLVSTVSVVTQDDEGSHSLDHYHSPDTQGGYAQSKWVQERMVRHFGFSQWGVPCLTFRPGLIVSHSKTGASNPDDLIMRLIRGIFYARAAPSLQQAINVVPVDFVAQAIVLLSLNCLADNAAFNVCGAQSGPINSLFEAMQSVSQLHIVDYEEWLTILNCPPGAWVESLPEFQSFAPLFAATTWEQLFGYSIQDLMALKVPEAAATLLHRSIAELEGKSPSQASPLAPYLPQLARSFPAVETFATPLAAAKKLGLECGPFDPAFVVGAVRWLQEEGFDSF